MLSFIYFEYIVLISNILLYHISSKLLSYDHIFRGKRVREHMAWGFTHNYGHPSTIKFEYRLYWRYRF